MKGDVIVVPFPFSDLSQAKKRPALVITNLQGDDIILCQITSKSISDQYSIELKKDDFKKGRLKIDSNIRPNRLFTADIAIILYKVGTIKQVKIQEVIDKLIHIISLN